MWCRGVSAWRYLPGGVCSGGCLPRRGVCPGGVCLEDSQISPEMATAAVCTHSTGMHTCVWML